MLKQEDVKSSVEGYHAGEKITLKAVFDLSPDAITIIDLKGNIIECNQATLELLGCLSLDEVIGKNGFVFVAERDRERAIENFKKVLEQGSMKIIEYVAVTKDGREFLAELSASIIKDPLGNPIYLVGITKDVTERKKAEEELRETKNYLDNLLNYANAPIIVWDNENKISLFNNAFEALTGYKKESVLGRNIDALFPPLQKEEILQTIEKATKGERWQSVEVPILCKGKETRIALWNSANIKDKDGNIVATIAQGQDITERKKAEEALRESEEKWRSLAENAPNIIIIVDRVGTIQFINRTIVDARPEEIVGKSIYDFIGPEHHNVVKKTIEQVFQTGEGRSYEISGIGPKGSVSWYATQVGPIKQDGQIVSATLITTDITERKKAEEKLDESEKKFKSIFEGARDGILAVDAKTKKFVLANPRILELTGYSEKELLRLGVEDIHPEKDLPYVMDAFTKQLQRKIEVGRDMPVLRKDRNVIYCDINSYLLEVRGRKLLVGLFRDVTERKNMEEQLKEYSEQLEEKVEERTIQLKKAQEQLLQAERFAAVGEVANMVGHDLRNPLQSIENAAYYLNSELSNISAPVPISQKTMEMLKVINDSINYADKIILDLQDFSGTKKPILEKTDINAIVKETISQFQIPKNVKLISELDRLPEIKADKNQMKRVFLNLTSNALQAMENGGTLTVSTKTANGFVEVSFKDTGAGIAKENKEKLFTPLFTTKAKGMGMGLPICKKFVESHGGSIEVETEEEKGSTFRVKLPLPRENGGENP